MNQHITAHRNGFGPGFTPITSHDDPADPTKISVGVLVLRTGEAWRAVPATETAWLLMSGAANGSAGGRRFEFHRGSLFDESASCVHVAAGTPVEITAAADCEFTMYACANARTFEARTYGPRDVPNEHRGRGQVRNRSLRFVRTIFDLNNAPSAAELVLGEVVTMPGGWSSYPPHHHAQPEVYHYRFTAPQGYGHAELGDDVMKVRQFDTVRIPAGLDHAQCAAPGYGMYYSWVVRHLPGNPYTIPEFTAEHAWTMKAGASFWWPRELPDD